MSFEPPTKRTRLDLAEQDEVGNLIQSRSDASHVVTTYNGFRQNVTKIKKNLARIIEKAQSAERRLTKKTSRDPRFTPLEEKMYDLVVAARQQKYLIAQCVIKKRALLNQDISLEV